MAGKKQVKKQEEEQEQPVVDQPAPVETVVTEDVPQPVTTDRFVTVLETLHGFQNQVKELIATVKVLQKEHSKLQKQKGKKTRRVAEDGATKRQPSGFAKPTKLSDQLCDFLGVAHGTSMARTEVTRLINDYIKKNSLQNPADRRKIIPDAKLKAILNFDEEKGLSYFSIQSSLKHQFTKEQ